MKGQSHFLRRLAPPIRSPHLGFPVTPDARSQTPWSRRGSALAMALVALLVVTLVAGTLVQSLLAAHRQLHRYRDELQAQWLADAGLARAAARLKSDANYQGEVWNVRLGTDAASLDEGSAAATGIVTITVAPAEKRITVEATYPPDNERRILVRRESNASPDY